MPPFNLMYRANNQIIAVNNINSNSYTTSISPIQNTLYQIVSLSNGSICEASIKDSLFVKVTPKKPIIPNAFSPNGDGINDTWILKNMLGYPNAEIIVFNRYGQPVYTTKNYNTANAFNGKYNNIPLPVGTYYYVINLQNKTAPLHGAVTILR
jgi:gliding motility-associated-like protein